MKTIQQELAEALERIKVKAESALEGEYPLGADAVAHIARAALDRAKGPDPLLEALKGLCEWLETRPAGIRPDLTAAYHAAKRAIREATS